MVEYCNKCHGDLGCICPPEIVTIHELRERVEQLEQELNKLKHDAEKEIS